MVNANITIPDDIHKKAKISALILDLDLKDYIIIAIKEKNETIKGDD